MESGSYFARKLFLAIIMCSYHLLFFRASPIFFFDRHYYVACLISVKIRYRHEWLNHNFGTLGVLLSLHSGISLNIFICILNCPTFLFKESV